MNRIFLLYILFYTSFQVIPGSIKGQSDYYFKQVSLAEGLSHSSVRCLYRDHQGILWIGTRNGLNRYDSYELQNFYHEKDNPESLPDNNILFITEDSLHNLWIATQKQLVRYDRVKQHFIPVTSGKQQIDAKAYLPIAGGLLFTGSKNLWKYSYKNRKFETLPLTDAREKPYLFQQMLRWTSDLILLRGRWNGLCQYNRRDHRLTPVPFFPEQPVAAMYVDSLENIWVSPYGKGLYCYSSSGKQLFHYTAHNSQLANDVILDIAEKDGKLWLATDGSGIRILDPDTHTFSSIEHVSDNPYSLPVNTVLCLYKDRNDMIWAGTHRAGVFLLKKVFIQTYKNVTLNNKYGLSEKCVNCLYEDQNGSIWIGTDGGGLNRFDPSENSFRHYTSTIPLKIVSITAYSEHRLLLSCYNKGFFLFDTKLGQLFPFTVSEQGINYNKIARRGISVNLLAANSDKIYFLGDRIYPYDKTTKTFSVLSSDIPPANQSGLNIIGKCDSVAWLLGKSTIFQLHFPTNRLKNLHILSSLEEINACCRDTQGNFWIGTNTGLYRYDPVLNEEKKIQTGLLNSVNSLIFGSPTQLWIGAQNILLSYNIPANKFAIFGEGNGVQSNEFLAKPTLKSSSGDLYIGGVAGLVHINRSIPINEDPEPILTLANVTIDGQSVESSELQKSKKLTLPYKHSSIRVKIITMEKDFFREKRYRYSLNNDYSNYVETPNPNFPLGPLAPGNYHLYVQGNTSNGDWTEPKLILSLEVTPPWWSSPWFILLGLFILISGSVIGFAVYARKKENRYKWEMKEHEQKIYEQKVQFLINISHELRTPLTLIYAPLKRILQQHTEQNELTNQLTDIYKQAKKMKSMINMVLDIRKMELGHESLYLEPHFLNRWLKEVAEEFKPEFESKNIHLEYRFDPGIQEIHFDRNKCELILSNLLMNALKFSLPDTTVLLSTSQNTQYVRISVTDQGIGLQNISQEQLFTRFKQGIHDRGGSGIGLSYAKVLTEMHGGRIGATDNPGKAGSTFYFELPLCAQSETKTCAPGAYINELLDLPATEIPETQTFSLKEYTLLIAEDETDLRQFLKNSLKEHFKHVHTASNGNEALETILNEQPDLVVSDVMMPGMNGFELCKQLKEDIRISHIPVILLTARSDAESTQTGYKTGADGYITKPFELDFLLTIIYNQLKNRERIKLKYRQEKSLLPPEEMAFSNADEKFLNQLNSLINNELNNPDLNVNLLTEKMAFSRASLYNKVKALTDMGVNDYIMKFRLGKARQLLSTTDLSILEISESVGFTNQRYFSTAFKQASGCTPTQYRTKHKLRPENKMEDTSDPGK